MIAQKIIFERPPIFDEARAQFGPGVERAIFSWGAVIYNPGHISIPRSLVVHEAVHGERQLKADIECWWRSYLDGHQFRLQEEIPAHQAEFRFLQTQGNRQERRAALAAIAKRLSGPLYGHLIALNQAKQILRGAA